MGSARECWALGAALTGGVVARRGVIPAGAQIGDLVALRAVEPLSAPQARALASAMGGRLTAQHGRAVSTGHLAFSLATIAVLVQAGYLTPTAHGWDATREAFRCFRRVREFASRTRRAFRLDDDGNDLPDAEP